MSSIREKLASIDQFKDSGKIVFARTDYNVSVTGGKIADDARIKASIPTLKYLTGLGSRILVASHMGRPEGRFDPALSLKPVAKRLAELLERKFVEADADNLILPDYPVPHVIFVSGDPRNIQKQSLLKMRIGDILVFENIRFLPGEDSKSSVLAKSLVELCDVYVNEAFSVSHHGSATVSLMPKMVPSYAGLEIMEELQNLDFVLTTPRKPMVLVIGGAKMADKAGMLSKLLPRCDHVLVGGAMANLFLSAKGNQVGDSLVDKDGLVVAKDMLRNYREKIVLPPDLIVIGQSIDVPRVTNADGVKSHEKIMDLGPGSIIKYAEIIKTADIIVWNGPLGVFEDKRFSHATLALARLIASRAGGQAYAIAGGGETLAALEQTGMRDFVDYVSMGGGAMLSYLGGTAMPGLESLIGQNIK